MALAALADVKEYLDLETSDTTQDALLTNLIDRASSFIEMWLGRIVLSESYFDLRDGNGHRAMVFINNPITAVSSLKINGNIIPVSTDWNVPGYIIDNYQIVLIGYVFDKGIRNVSMSYTGGYATVPNDIKQACVELVAKKYKSRAWIGQRSKSVGGESVSFSTDDINAETKVILNNYKNVMTI